MKWFLDLTTRGKLLVGIGMMVLFLVIVIVTAYSGITSINKSEQGLYQKEFANVIDLLNLRSDQNGVRAALLSLMYSKTPTERNEWLEDISRRANDINNAINQLLERNRDDAELAAQIKEFANIYNAFEKTRDNEILPLLNTGKDDEALALIAGIQNDRYLRMRAIAAQLGQDSVTNARMAVEESTREAQQSLSLFVILGSVAIVLGLLMVSLLNRLIAEPLRAVSGLAGQIATGDLTVSVPTENRADEVGDLLRAFREMVTKLRQTTRQLHESVGVLASSSSEILATTTQVAAGASETATAVNETTATVEEVKQTAQLANQKARYVFESAQKVTQVSQHGRKSVDDAIAGMHRIQEQMEFIAESIVRLSEQSQAIGEIITTVNDLAEQSNVLAVNAAIEANKAGEHGKGFAIVAQEVKSLAEQSKQATAQVRALLGDIQKATSSAVLATEKGHKAVESGVDKSSEASESIRQLADSINEAAQASTQISTSSQQQMVGMDQVALAMDNIKQASSQNVAGTKQAETAAQNLHELGLKLKQVAEQYRV